MVKGFSIPTNIHFGAGKLKELNKILFSYGKKCLLVTSNSRKDSSLGILYQEVINDLSKEGFEVTHYHEITPNPTADIVEKGIRVLQENNIDFVLAIGGGSSIDAAKAICLLNELDTFDWNHIFQTYTSPQGDYPPICERHIPLIAVPTTSGTGSEVTQASVISMGEDKNTIFHPLNFPDHAILDPELLLSLPRKLTAATGFDAFCHAFESYINDSASVFSELISLEAIKTISEYLVKTLDNLDNIEYRSKILYAQTLAGIGLSNAGASAPHPLSEIIGGITDISHGESLALVFPEFLDRTYEKHIYKFAKIARIFNPELNSVSDKNAAAQLGSIIKEFLISLDLYLSFDHYGVKEEQFSKIINSPILGFLPFGTKDELQSIILDSKNSRK